MADPALHRDRVGALADLLDPADAVLLAGIVHRFVYLKYGLAAVLVFVGVKMTLIDVYKIPIATSLAVVALAIGGSVAASLVWGARAAREEAADLG